MPKLVTKDKEYPLEQYASIGRSSKNTISFPEDAKLSRVHCEIIRDDNDFILIDLHSQNGTQRNGQYITETILAPNDLITLGRAELKFIV